MNAREVNVFLTKAALLDSRMKRVDPEEQADVAFAWAEVLAEVSLTAALSALVAHYRAEVRSIMPADVLRRVPAGDDRKVIRAGRVVQFPIAEGAKS